MKLRDRLCLGIGAAALGTSVLAVGGALRWTQAVVAVLVAGALSVQLLARRQLARLSPLVVLPAAACALTALQLIPLPASLLDWLSPVGNHLRIDGAAVAGTSPWMSISLDPAGSVRAIAFFLTLLGVALVSLRFATSERGRFVLLGAVAATCGLAAAVTGFHTLLNADSLYGLYAPTHAIGTPIMGPLLNPNHMGGLMALGAVLSLGLAFYRHQPTQLRVGWIVIGIACVVVTAASLSRGALVGMGIGLVVAAAVLVVGRSPGEHQPIRRLGRDLPVAIVVGAGIAVALYMSAGNVANQLQSTSISELNRPVSKYAAWKASIALVKEAPLVGVGRGAIESNLTRVYGQSAYFTFSHLENEYLTAVVEWGIPGALVLAAILAWCVVIASRRWRDGPLAAAALGALATVMFQSSVDFGIELLGIAVPATVIASTVQLVPLRPTSARGRVGIIRATVVLALLAAAALLMLPATRSLQEDHDDIRALDVPTLTDLKPAIQRHPLDYYSFGQAADAASRAGDVHAVDYLNQALALHPTHPGLHRLAARMLVGIKRYSQAAVEYAFAMDAQASPRLLLEEIVKLIPDTDDVAAAIPTDYPNIDVMLHALHDIKRPDISEKWLMRIAERPQHDVRVIDTLYQLAMQRKDYDVAKHAAELRSSVFHTTTSRLMLAQVLFQLQEYDRLINDLADVRKWTGRIDEKAQAWMIYCDVRIARHEWDPALECIHRLDASGLMTTGARIEIAKRLQSINESRAYESKMQAIQAMEKSLGSGSAQKP